MEMTSWGITSHTPEMVFLRHPEGRQGSLLRTVYQSGWLCRAKCEGSENMTDNMRVMLTPEGRANLEARVDEMANEELPAMRPLLVEDERDERVVADFERLQAEHDRLVVLLGTSGTLDLDNLGPQITLGSRVVITDAEGQRRVVRIVDPVEAFLDEERISNTSPLASSLLGHVAGDTCEVAAPAGTWTAKILSVGEDI